MFMSTLACSPLEAAEGVDDAPRLLDRRFGIVGFQRRNSSSSSPFTSTSASRSPCSRMGTGSAGPKAMRQALAAAVHPGRDRQIGDRLRQRLRAACRRRGRNRPADQRMGCARTSQPHKPGKASPCSVASPTKSRMGGYGTTMPNSDARHAWGKEAGGAYWTGTRTGNEWQRRARKATSHAGLRPAEPHNHAVLGSGVPATFWR